MNAQNTLHAFTNKWECDENNHLNVQFYFGHIEEADRQFQFLSGLTESIVGPRRMRHMRFHKELRSGDLITVRSAVAFDGPHLLTVVHELTNSATGELCATAIDGYEPQASSVKVLRTRFKDFRTNMPEIAAPHSLPAGGAVQRVTRELLAKTGAIISHRATVLPRDLSIDNKAGDAFAVRCFTEAAPHVWQTTPLTADRLDQTNAGRVVLEMKLSWLSPIKLGDMVLVKSSISQVQEKTFCLRHYLFEARTNRLAATCDVVTGMLDRVDRKLISIPDDDRHAMSGLVLA